MNFAARLCFLVALCLFAQDLLAATLGPNSVRLLTREGRVDVAARGTTAWRSGQTNDVLQYGDGLRTAIRSRATLQFSDLSLLRVNQLTTMEIQPPTAAGQKPVVDLKSGAGFFFSRDQPTEVQFRTPVASGAIRGTEFNVEVGENGRTIVTLLDGEVVLQNEQGSVTLRSGEQGIAELGQAPTNRFILDAVNIIQWALYYPVVLDPNDLRFDDNTRAAWQASVAAYRTGDLQQALANWPENPAGSDAERVWRAGLLLTVGQVAAAEQLLGELSRQHPGERALRELIAAVKQTDHLVTAGPATASEWMAHSYYLQSRSQLGPALAAAQQATQRSPEFGAAWIRVAELEFSHARTSRALQALDRGLSLSPRNAHGLALRGFLLSARGDFAEAQDQFEQAIAADNAYGNAWLGRGLVKIRRGDRLGGRADLQVAAALEPQRSILRSYLAKAFQHEGDEQRAQREIGLARRLDERDPTPFLYSALLKQQNNQINEAVQDLETSQDLNDNRSVYRSRLLLDQDQAVRSANLASIYRDAGMVEVSAREAARGVSYDYGNYSAHLFLANSYDALRDPRLINLRYETPWFSELLVANLLAPVGGGNLSQTISQQEYARFFEGDHIGVYSGTEYYSHGEWRQEGSQYGNLGNFGYSLDAYYRTDPGQRPNNDQEQLTLSAKVKQQLTPKDSLFLQALYFNGESGDVAQYYNNNGQIPGVTSFDPTLRVKERQEPNLFLGYHHEWQPGVHTLALAGRLDDTFNLEGTANPFRLTTDLAGNVVLPPFFISPRPATPIDYRSEFEAYTVELQQIWQQTRHTIVAGGRYQTGGGDTTVTPVLPGALSQEVDTSLERFSAYAYYYWRVVAPLQLIAGVSYDSLDYPRNIDTLPPISSDQLNKDQFSPKAGFYLTPLDNTVIRGVYSRSLGGMFYDTSVRLEPTQIAGFNQAFRSLIPESVVGLVPGSEFETFGLALDQDFKETGTYVSVMGELLYSEAERNVGAYLLPPLGVPNLIPTSLHEDLEYRERSVAATVNQLVGKLWSVGATYRYTEADLIDKFEELDAFDQDVSATLHQVNLYALVNLSCGFFGGVNSIWSQQSNRDYTPDIPGDDFWQHNVFAGYRFLQRRAEARVALLNILDQDYRLNPLTLYRELPRDRTLALSLRLYF